MSANKALESSSVSVRRCKNLLDSAVHEYCEELDSKSKLLFVRLVTMVRANSNLLRPSCVAGPNAYRRIKGALDVMEKLVAARRYWNQEPWGWYSNEKSFVKGLRSLIDHLLVRSDVPNFLYMCWLSDRTEGWEGSRKLFLHLAAGNSVRGYQTSTPITKLMAKRFFTCPDHFDIRQAFKFARDPDFEVAKKAYSATDSRRRRKRRVFEKSHRIGETWRHSPISDFHLVENETGKPWSYREWSIKQILSEQRLLEEGRRQNHCVGSYLGECVDGSTTIWAMECRGAITVRPAVTVEVTPDRQIITALGHNNRSAKYRELEVIVKWAQCEKLRLSNWLWSKFKTMRDLQR